MCTHYGGYLLLATTKDKQDVLAGGDAGCRTNRATASREIWPGDGQTASQAIKKYRAVAIIPNPYLPQGRELNCSTGLVHLMLIFLSSGGGR